MGKQEIVNALMVLDANNFLTRREQVMFSKRIKSFELSGSIFKKLCQRQSQEVWVQGFQIRRPLQNIIQGKETRIYGDSFDVYLQWVTV